MGEKRFVLGAKDPTYAMRPHEWGTPRRGWMGYPV